MPISRFPADVSVLPKSLPSAIEAFIAALMSHKLIARETTRR